jgi:hypothetical protein
MGKNKQTIITELVEENKSLQKERELLETINNNDNAVKLILIEQKMLMNIELIKHISGKYRKNEKGCIVIKETGGSYNGRN